MTAIVGLLCDNGCVIGTDSSATFAAGRTPTIEQPTEKLHIIGDSVVVAGTGQVGLGQRFCAVVDKWWQGGNFNGSPLEIAKALSALCQQDFASTGVQKGQYGALVAFYSEGKFSLCEFAVPDFQPELKIGRIWYCSMGSGQPITDPFLAFMREVFWEGVCPNTVDGVFAVTWALDHVISVNPGGINGPARIAVLELNPEGAAIARLLDDDELLEHRQHIHEAKQLLKDHREKLRSGSGDDIPEAPRA